jgi:hypothetical protein
MSPVHHALFCDSSGHVTKWRCLLDCGHVVTVRTTGDAARNRTPPTTATCDLCIPPKPAEHKQWRAAPNPYGRSLRNE